MMDTGKVLAAADGAVATITLNRPERLVGLDTPTLAAVNDAFARMASDSTIRAVVLSGAGRAFCAGADVKESGRIIDAAEATEIGAVSAVVLGKELMAVAREFAGRLAAGPSVAIGLAKENIQDHWNTTIESTLRNEFRAAGICPATADHEEGLQAANEKCPPQFIGY